jgi:hypothetical protein
MGKGKRRPGVGSVSLLVILALRPPGEVMAQAGSCYFRGTPEALAERPSPLDSVVIELGGDRALLCYGRPSARGRSIVGDQDPYGAPWRLGANEPTTLHLPFPASIGGVAVGSGSYSLYAIPEASSWTIVVNGNTTRWGIPIDVDVRASDVGSFTVPVGRLDRHVETLEFVFEARDSHRGDLVYRWENTTFRIPIERR